ncbi:MAG: TPM domain-containing protein [Patescibacteria group bacterium]|nr:TPM domain-containing protein [Patescibacteria group bacterium]
MRRFRRLFAGLALALALPASAYYNPGTPSGFVSDYANLLNAGQRQALEAKLAQFSQATRHELAVVTIPSLQGDTIENFAVGLFQDWGIGKKGADNGILLLIAKDDREMRIEIGYGLEGALTDAQASWIIANVMRPAFRAGQYFEGIDGAVDKIIGATKGETVPSATGKMPSFNLDVLQGIFWGVFAAIGVLGALLGRSKSFWLGGLIGAVLGGIAGIVLRSVGLGLLLAGVLGLAGLLFDFVVSRKKPGQRKNRIWWMGGGWPGHRGGGFGGGGFGGFGGGSSGGGGASGKW